MKCRRCSTTTTMPKRARLNHIMMPSKSAAMLRLCDRELLESILKDEDAHIDGIEEIQDQIKQMGLGIFLSIQVG